MTAVKTGYRNISIEILRIVAMLLILACHSVIHLDWGLMSASGWKLAVSNMVVQCGQLGVAVFFMITGYFCVNKEQRYSRLIGIWIQVAVYGLICLGFTLVARAFGLLGFLNEFLTGWGLATTLKKELMPISSCAYWFMTAYFCVMLLSPFLNTLVHCVNERTVLGLVVSLVLCESSFLIGWVPFPLNWCSKAVTCYLVGAIMPTWSRFVNNNWLKTVLTSIACLACLVAFNYLAKSDNELVAWLGWKSYYHDGPWLLWMLPAALLLNMAAKSKWSPPSSAATVLSLLSSATFGVYLLHENYLGYRILWSLVNKLMAVPRGAAMKAMALPLVVLTLFLALAIASMIIDALLVKRLRRGAQLKAERVGQRIAAIRRGD